MIDGGLSYAPLARYNFGKNEVIQASLNPSQPHEVVLSAENSSIIAKICKQGKSPHQITKIEEIGAQCVGEEKDDAKGSDLKDTTLRSGHIDDGSDDGKRSSEEVCNDQEETKDESVNDDEDRDESIKDGDKDISDEDEDINDGDEVVKVEDEDNEDEDGDINDGGTNRESIDVDDETIKTEGDGREGPSTGSNVGGTSSLMSDPQTIKDRTQQPTDAPNLRRRRNEGTVKSKETETTSTTGVSKDPEYSLTVGQENRTDFAEKESLQKVARFSCDGRFVITGGVDGCMRVWEVSVYMCLYCTVHTTEVFSLQGCPHYRGVLTTEVSSPQRCPRHRGVLTTGVSSLQRCPHYRGVLTTEVSSPQRCLHYRGVLTTGVSSLQRCPHYRGVLTTEVSSLQGCPHYRGVLTTEVSSLQRCPHHRGVLTTEVS